MSKSAKVRNYMSSRLVTLDPAMPIHQAIGILLKNGISGAPVIDVHGRLIGILSKKDCLKVAFNASYHQDLGGAVFDYMTHDPETIDAEADILQAAERFLAGPYRRFPVMADGQTVGLISRHDVLRALADLW
jgi:CBS domain-containing protein